MKFTAIIALAFIGLASAEPRHGADNVCLKTQPIPKLRRVERPREYTIKYKEPCNVVGTCEKTKKVVEFESVLDTVVETRVIRQCCSGYAEAPNGDCLPICLNSCRNGDCVAPGECKCNPEPTDSSPGFTGSTCNRFVCLAINRWGPKCDKICNCPPNSYCKATTGECACRAGWTGADCSEECGFGKKCDEPDSLPPIADPEANLISSALKLESIERSATTDAVADDRSSLIHQLAAHSGMNMILIFVVFTMLVVILAYRKRLNRVRNELYYSTYSTVSSNRSAYGNNSTHSGDSGETPISKRPMPPTPDQASFYGKNLDFDMATRVAVTGIETGNPCKVPMTNDRFIVDPRTEGHLLKSQEKSKQNLYSDISSCGTETSRTASNIIMTDDGHYQVPKAQVRPKVDTTTTSDQNGSIYDYDDSCLYEEIKPRPHQKSDESSPKK